MPFFKSQNTIQDTIPIEVLLSRLDYSEYKSDKIDALEDLNKLAETNVLEIGTFGIDSICKSLTYLEDKSLGRQLLYKIFKSEYFNEFVEILIKNKDNLEILLESDFYDLLIHLVQNTSFKKIFSTLGNVSVYLINKIETGNTELLKNMINVNDDFDKELVFSGVFEKLIEYKKYELIRKLLRDNFFNQNYFIETDWYRLKDEKFIFDILEDLVDNKNSNVEYIKSVVYKYIKFNKDQEGMEFTYKMILNSKRYLEEYYAVYRSVLQDSNDSLENTENEKLVMNDSTIKEDISEDNGSLITDSLIYFIMSHPFVNISRSKCEYLIIYELLKYKKDEMMKDALSCSVKQDEIDYLIRTDIKGYTNLLLLLAISDVYTERVISISDISPDTILYFVILAPREIIIENGLLFMNIFEDKDTPLFYRHLCFFICVAHEIKMNYNSEYKKSVLKELRRLIVNEECEYYIIDEYTNLIIEKINELIK